MVCNRETARQKFTCKIAILWGKCANLFGSKYSNSKRNYFIFKISGIYICS